ncbi:DMT family transporter [Gammaproteobacteria bacterium]|nr:DMT family transporter [Gammaproteobacteria bacterium]
MINVLMGAGSAVSLGVADFMASQSSEKIGAPRALAGMLFVSTVVLTVFLVISGKTTDLLDADNARGLLLGILHGVTMACALVLFFHAMAIGKLSVVAPIIAAHPVFIVAFAFLAGGSLVLPQLVAIAIVLTGVALVGSSAHSDDSNTSETKRHTPTKIVVGISLVSSLLYAGAIIALQQASQNLSELPVLWLGRTFGLLTIVLVILCKRQSPLPPSAKWWPFFLLHGFLDSGGMLFILLGTNGTGDDAITAVVASTFPVITVLLAWIILKERMTVIQILGGVSIFAGVATLIATGSH